MAYALGLSQQEQEFIPEHHQTVREDVNVGEFIPGTIAILNLVMRNHSQGLKPVTLQELLQYSVTPEMQQQLMEDLVIKRNEHLPGEIHAHIAESDLLIVP